MKKSDQIAITGIVAGILILVFLGIAWTKFKPIKYFVPEQYPVGPEFGLWDYGIIPETKVEIAPNNYSYFVKYFEVPEDDPEKNITVISAMGAIYWGSDGPFRVYVFDIENFEKWRNGEPCSTVWEVLGGKPVEINENVSAIYGIWFPIERSQNLYIVFENTHTENIHLTVKVDSVAWCSQITGYITEYLPRYDYTWVGIRFCLLIFAIITTMLALAILLSHYRIVISVVPRPSLERKIPAPPSTTDELYDRLEKRYTGAYGPGTATWVLQRKIQSYLKQGLTREEAIRKVAQDEGYR